MISRSGIRVFEGILCTISHCVLGSTGDSSGSRSGTSSVLRPRLFSHSIPFLLFSFPKLLHIRSCWAKNRRRILQKAWCFGLAAPSSSNTRQHVGCLRWYSWNRVVFALFRPSPNSAPLIRYPFWHLSHSSFLYSQLMSNMCNMGHCDIRSDYFRPMIAAQSNNKITHAASTVQMCPLTRRHIQVNTSAFPLYASCFRLSHDYKNSPDPTGDGR